MKNITLLGSFFLMGISVFAQYEPWSDPIAITDSNSYNSKPCILVLETNSYLFYEKKFSSDGPSKIYYRDIKNMGEETELLSDPIYSYRNPQVSGDFYPEDNFFLIYESDQAGNYDIYALKFDPFLNFDNPVQLTYTFYDENNTNNSNYTDITCWEINGNILVADLIKENDTVYFQNTSTIDYAGCSEPYSCNTRIVYRKLNGPSNHLYYSDWNSYYQQWTSPSPVDTLGNSSYCHCSMMVGGYTWEDCILYEKEGGIFNSFYGSIYELVLPVFNNDMHQPASIQYDLPVEFLPASLFVSFMSSASGYDDIYVNWTMEGEYVENLSNDTLVNSNPQLLWGWYGESPCSMYLLDIWQTHKNGYTPLYMSKTSLYVCGGIEESEANNSALKVYPNPFASESTIRFNLKNKYPIKIDILNQAGQLIHMVNIKNPVVGWNEYTFSPGQNIPRGILYIKLTQGRKQLFRKVIYK